MKMSNVLPQCSYSNDTIYEICVLYALLFCYSRHLKPSISYKEYDCYTNVTIVLVFRHVHIGGMAKQHIHYCIIKFDSFDTFSVSLRYKKKLKM